METITVEQITEKEIPNKKEKREAKKKEKAVKQQKEIINSEIGKSVLERTNVYIYPVDVRKNVKKEKQFRSLLRGKLKRYVDTYLLETNIKKNKDFDSPKLFEEFIVFYKTNYSTNDFSISSLRTVIDETEKEELSKFLSALQKYICK